LSSKAKPVDVEDLRERLASIELLTAPRDIVVLGRALVVDAEALVAQVLLSSQALYDGDSLLRALPNDAFRETLTAARALSLDTKDSVRLLRSLVSHCAKLVPADASAVRLALRRYGGLKLAAAASVVCVAAGLSILALESVGKQKRDDFNALCSKGSTQQSANDHMGAVESFKAALSSAPDHDRAATAWNDLGWSLHSLGKDEEAITAYKNALLLRPGFDRARNNLELSQRALDLRNAAKP
jgi:tetratricopeptide (TPR) repeat protein